MRAQHKINNFTTTPCKHKWWRLINWETTPNINFNGTKTTQKTAMSRGKSNKNYHNEEFVRKSREDMHSLRDIGECSLSMLHRKLHSATCRRDSSAVTSLHNLSISPTFPSLHKSSLWCWCTLLVLYSNPNCVCFAFAFVSSP